MEKQNVLIVGGGYVGLPLAVEAGLAGVYSVKVLDNDEEKVKKINSGVSYIEDVQEASLLESDIVATTDKTIAGDADVVVICVPTPLRKTKDPDISYVVNAAREVAENLDLERGSMGPREVLIILESTVYPGFTREVLVSIFEDAGCPVSDRGPLHIAFSPERVDPGNSTYCTHNTPRVVGGVTDTCRDKAISFYRSFLSAEIVPMSSCDAAEMVKLLENSFRAVNIGMANELALICSRLGLSTREIVDGAKTKPFGFMPFYPGPGLGGHCIPVDPLYLSWKMKGKGYRTRFIDVADEINTRMPEYVVDLVSRALNSIDRAIRHSYIFVYGVAYKENTSDVRESPALLIMEELTRRGAYLRYIDPFVPKLRMLDGTELESVEHKGSSDCGLILAAHRGLPVPKEVLSRNRVVVDTRGYIPLALSAAVYRL